MWVGSLEASGMDRHVVVKKTRNKQVFDSEVFNRKQHKFNSKHVLQVLRTHTPPGGDFVIVLPLCKTSISTAVIDEGYVPYLT